MAATGAALVVHDLKNALGALEANLAALSRRPERAAAVLAHRQCRQLRQRLVGYLAVYGHEGRLQAHLQDESPAEVLQALVARHGDDAPPLLVTQTEAAPVLWHFDRHLVLMALESAVHNAVHFARQQVELRARGEDGCLVFSVLDDGPGPGPEAGTAEHATGLGTALCRAVARAHGCTRDDGGVRLMQRAGGGACFELWLPT
jgi:signal transduction histidine kinase